VTREKVTKGKQGAIQGQGEHSTLVLHRHFYFKKLSSQKH